MAASEEPSPRVWLNIAAQLRAEGLIREQEVCSRPAHSCAIVPATRMERVVAGADCCCIGGGRLLRGQP